MTARDRWLEHPLCAPRATMPDGFWGPEQLELAAYRELVELTETASEVQALKEALSGIAEVVDVGGGAGLVARELAERMKVTVIEPAGALREQLPPNVEGRAGRAESLPLEDRSVEAALATWVLQHTYDPLSSIEELARVASRKVAIVQAAPNNDLVAIYNRQAAVAGAPPAHHGWLLVEAASRLEEAGFDVALSHVPIAVRAPAGGARTLAMTLARLHFSGHPALAAIIAATEPFIASRLAAGKVCDDGALLVAERRS
ncbi:MAG: class I SAM-dependent methyltransferase [Deltaproteobacteria bacterium]|nr:class I SAM-dependent methyltransferase [Deltaproteobacteria bacterium]